MSEMNSFDINSIVKYKKLIAELLEKAADRFSNHGCNEVVCIGQVQRIGTSMLTAMALLIY